MGQSPNESPVNWFFPKKKVQTWAFFLCVLPVRAAQANYFAFRHQTEKFLGIFKGIFSKSPLNGVWGNAPMKKPQTVARPLYGCSFRYTAKERRAQAEMDAGWKSGSPA